MFFLTHSAAALITPKKALKISLQYKGVKALGNQEEDVVVHIPIDGILDLHMFSPEESTSVVDEYLQVCREKGIYEVKIIHGKGKGVLRRTIQAFLAANPLVASFKLDSGPSGWGASIVYLKKIP